jgi:hypothetical protein
MERFRRLQRHQDHDKTEKCRHHLPNRRINLPGDDRVRKDGIKAKVVLNKHKFRLPDSTFRPNRRPKEKKKPESKKQKEVEVEDVERYAKAARAVLEGRDWRGVGEHYREKWDGMHAAR